MWNNPDAYPEMIIARAHDEIRELDRQQRARRTRAVRRHRLGRLLTGRLG